MRPKSPNYLAASMALLCMVMLSCSSAPVNSSTSKNAQPKKEADPNKTGDTTQADSSTGVTGSGSVVGPPQVAKVPVPVADAWCAAAAQTGIVKAAGIAKGYAQFCSGGKATQLLASTLVSNAFAGSGSPAFQYINPITVANSTVSAFFGIGIKLPITAKDEFYKVGPEQGTVANATQLVKNQGDTPGNIQSVPLASNPDKGWVRGWTLTTASTKAVTLVKIATEYTTQVDQYDLGNGLFMYTSTLKSSKSTMKDYQLLSASFDLNGAGYLNSVALVAADDHGFPKIAQQTVTTIANALITFMYQKSSEPH